MANVASTYYSYPTPYGAVTIRTSARGVCEISFGQVSLAGAHKPSTISNEAATQIQEYFAGKRWSFDVPLDINGSAFQNLVWEAVSEIPYGECRSSADIAEMLGKPGSHRSVGTAVRRNPVPLLIPTHRVLMASPATKNERMMHALLAFEQRNLGS
ncbi:MAG: methylated-DNA--[Eggerthellaceae bacterium]|nr:methylated-DNA--[protein]-cysteine S-methyltransferase [Eggerthellaceae bacterium]